MRTPSGERVSDRRTSGCRARGASCRRKSSRVRFFKVDGHGGLRSVSSVRRCVESLCASRTAAHRGRSKRDMAGGAAAGVDITTLNKVRATTSLIGGRGAASTRSFHARSTSLILVDNVVSGAEWVASAMTYDYRTPSREVDALWATDRRRRALRARMRSAFDNRRDSWPPTRTRRTRMWSLASRP